MSNPTPLPLDAAAWDELARLATETRDAWNAYAAAPDTAAGNDARVDYLTLREDFKAACSPDVILALLAAVERGEAETFTADDVLDVYVVGCWDGGMVNRPKPGQERRAAAVVRRARDARDAARAHPPIQETDNA